MKDILDKKIEKVVVSNRLVSSPCCIVTSQVTSIMVAHLTALSVMLQKIHNADLPLSVWLDGKHGENHEGAGAEGHLYHGIHGC